MLPSKLVVALLARNWSREPCRSTPVAGGLGTPRATSSGTTIQVECLLVKLSYNTDKASHSKRLRADCRMGCWVSRIALETASKRRTSLLRLVGSEPELPWAPLIKMLGERKGC